MTPLRITTDQIDERWLGYEGLFGGFVAGLLVDAAITQSSFRLVSFSANFVSSVMMSDLRIDTDHLHSGRSTQLIRLELVSDERVRMYASAEFVNGSKENTHHDGLWLTKAPSVSRPEPTGDLGRAELPFDQLFETQRSDPPRVSGATNTWARVHPDVSTPLGLASPEALLAVFLDLPTPGLFGASVPPAFIPTIDYTLHFPPRLAWDPASWLRIEHTTAWATRNDCADDVRAWDANGNLVALARQTRSVRWGSPAH